METKTPAPPTIDAYIAGCPPEVQPILEKIRAVIQAAAPDAQETIKYKMPTFVLNGNLVYFAAFKNHIGFYPPTTGPAEFKRALAAYAGPRGSLKFPLDQPMPYDLIRQIVIYRIKENSARSAARQKK